MKTESTVPCEHKEREYYLVCTQLGLTEFWLIEDLVMFFFIQSKL